MIWAITISISDFGNFWAMISLTGNWVWNEVPRSPVMMLPSHVKYR